MIALDQIRQQGFTIKPVATGLYIDPIDELTEAQRQWIIGNKPAIRAELLAERWQWFLSLASDHGIQADVVAAEFPTDMDIMDVIEPHEHTDDLLVKCMLTLCGDARVRQRQQVHEAGRWVPVTL